jgi:hypothetical protein
MKTQIEKINTFINIFFMVEFFLYIIWPKEKVQKDKQRSTKYTHTTKDRVTRTKLKTGGELGCSGRVGSSCSTSDTRRVNLVSMSSINVSRHPHRNASVSSLCLFSNKLIITIEMKNVDSDENPQSGQKMGKQNN